MTGPHILFVDDEPSVLSGLRRSLWKRRDEWALHWSNSADEALDYLAREHVDILVTDMRMPGRDGVALLEETKRLYPATMRLVLSGHADQSAIIAAAGPTQQFLSKPCDPEVLDRLLSSAVATLGLTTDQGVRALMGSQQNLPKPPSIYGELAALAGRPEAALKDIAAVISRDVGTTAEVLKLVNSSFFGLASDVTSIERALSLLGLDMVQALVLSGQVFGPSDSLPPGIDAGVVGGQGLRACLAVHAIGRVEDWETKLVGQLGLAALLHDVGLLVVGARPAAWQAYLALDPSLPTREREESAFGCSIGRASAYLLGLWGFSVTVVDILAAQPLDLADAATRQAATPAALAVSVARHLATRADDPADLFVPTEDDYLDAERLARWTAAVASD